MKPGYAAQPTDQGIARPLQSMSGGEDLGLSERQKKRAQKERKTETLYLSVFHGVAGFSWMHFISIFTFTDIQVYSQLNKYLNTIIFIFLAYCHR